MPGSDAAPEYLAEARRIERAVREAGAIALRTFKTALRSWTKSGNSPVSEADIAVDAFLRTALLQPDMGWLSEESVDDRARLGTERVLIVDPIDGTRAYIAGKDDWTISVALVTGGRPVSGIVFAPATDEMFVAARGHGATRNDAPLRIDGAVSGAARIAGPKNYLDLFTALDPAAQAVPKIHSLALRLTRVAQGAIDAAFAGGNSHDWDLAAADLLVHEAQGAMTTLAGEMPIYNRPDPVHGALLAAGRERHRRMLAAIRDAREFAPFIHPEHLGSA